MTRAGAMRHELVYREPVKATNPLGQRVPTAWTEVGRLWADIRPPNGTESLVAQEMKTTITHTIVSRCQSYAIRAAGEFTDVAGNRVFRVVAALAENQDRFQRVLAVEIVS